jgi:hypothetical protein
MRLQFGSGLCGLAGMRPMTSMSHLLNSHEPQLQKLPVLRPFLNLTRHDLQNYSEENGIKWVEDPTNVDRAYMRTRMRDMLHGLLHHSCNTCISAARAVIASMRTPCVRLLCACKVLSHMDVQYDEPHIAVTALAPQSPAQLLCLETSTKSGQAFNVVSTMPLHPWVASLLCPRSSTQLIDRGVCLGFLVVSPL